MMQTTVERNVYQNTVKKPTKSYLRLNFDEILLKNPPLPSRPPVAPPLVVLQEGAPALDTYSLTVGVLGGGPL